MTTKLNTTAAMFAALCCASALADYPGNPNFRNVSVINTATTRTDWVTNVTTIISQSTNPGYAAPVDWDRYSQPLAPGVDHIPAVLTKEGGWPTNMVCHMLRIHLDTPGLRFTGSDRCPEGWGEDMPESISKKSNGTYYKKRTVREKTSDFLARNRGAKAKGGKERDARIAFNLAAWLPWTSPYTNLWAEPYSPLYSDGASVSFSAVGGVANAAGDTVPQSMIVIYKDGTAELINSITEEKAKKIWFCAPAFVAEIVSAGQIPGHAMQIDPRTAMGISQDNKTLYLFFCDGRREGWSGGCYWSSLSTLLQAMGSWYAINLDGGGSTTFCVWDESSGKPMVLNRPAGGLRDNGSNAAIYYKMPDAMVGSYLYDDMDFLVQDILDGETPDGVTEINVLGDATFTAEHPSIPSGDWTLSSTNNASIGWEDGVPAQVPAGKRLTFRNIRVRTDTLSVAAGGTAVLNGATGFGEVSCATASGIEVAGAVPAGLRVDCAAAPGLGDIFATSSLPLASARAEAKKITCAADTSLVGDAVEEDGAVKLRWNRILDMGSHSGAIATTLDRGVVRVRVDDCMAEYASGYKLKLSLASEDGERSATQTLDFTGTGVYSFDTAGASDPAICASGYRFDYTVELVDADGEPVLNSDSVSGSMRIGLPRKWFSASAADDSAVGGQWVEKTAIEEGRFLVAEGSDIHFAADEPKGGRVRLETEAEFKGYFTDAGAWQLIDSVSAELGTPHGACFMAEGDSDAEPVWRALVLENDEPALKTLYGPAALNTPCKIVCEVDWSSGSAHVRYSVAVGDGEETVLVDETGASWFAGASSADVASGRVVASGTGKIKSLSGQYLKRRLEGIAIIMK